MRSLAGPGLGPQRHRLLHLLRERHREHRPEPHPAYPPISGIGGPPFHPNCVHVLTPFVERLGTEEEKKRGVISPEVLNRTPGELQRRYRKESPLARAK